MLNPIPAQKANRPSEVERRFICSRYSECPEICLSQGIGQKLMHYSRLNLSLFAMLLLLLSSVSCAPLLAGQAAIQGARVLTVAAASSAPTEDEIKDLKSSVTAFNDAFRCEDYPRAAVFVSPDKKEGFWPEADRFQGKIRLAEYELRDIQIDEKKNHATAILYFQYWRTESPIVKTVSFTQKWQYFEKDKKWRVSDSGFEAIPSNIY